MKRYFIPFLFLSPLVFNSCSKEDTTSPIIILNPDSNNQHFRKEPYIDPGAEAADDFTCIETDEIIVLNEVDINRYGTYNVYYSIDDEAGNFSSEIRQVDIILPTDDYYSQDYTAYDTCTSGEYIYTGLVQDCDCGNSSVIAGNISNFGLSASFILPVSGQYNQILTLDTIKADVYFLGSAIMSPMADTLFWEYSIQDSVATDVCRSVWIKN